MPSCALTEKARSKKAKGIRVFVLEMKILIHDFGRAVHLKRPSSSGEEPKSIWILDPQLVHIFKGGGSFLTVACRPSVQVPWSLVAIWIVRWTWYHPFQGHSRAVFVVRGSRSEGWKKVENVSLESGSQIFEETKRIQDPVQFIDRVFFYLYYF